MGWLAERFREGQGRAEGPLQIMYGIDGRSELTEETLDHLAGYAGSRPVRIGNAASGQLQLDIYGELIDSVYLFNKYAQPISYDDWTALSRDRRVAVRRTGTRSTRGSGRRAAAASTSPIRG